jgi:hypothetical protein
MTHRGISEFGIWNLFVIWDLSLGILEMPFCSKTKHPLSAKRKAGAQKK